MGSVPPCHESSLGRRTALSIDCKSCNGPCAFRQGNASRRPLSCDKKLRPRISKENHLIRANLLYDHKYPLHIQTIYFYPLQSFNTGVKRTATKHFAD